MDPLRLSNIIDYVSEHASREQWDNVGQSLFMAELKFALSNQHVNRCLPSC